MKPNKSIDGLTVKSAKKPAPSSPSDPIVKKSITKPSAKTAPRSVPKTIKKPTVKSAAKPVGPSPKTPEEVTVVADVSTISVEVEKPAESQTVDDFLKPVHAFDFDEESGELKESKMTKKEEKAERKANKKLEKEEKKLAKKEKKAGKKSHKIRNTIASILLVLVLVAGGFITWAVFWGNDIIAKITGGQGNVLDLFHWVDDNYVPLKTDAKGRTNILAFGTSGYNMDGDEGNGTHAGAQLTDSIMMISLNQETGDIAMLSLPRDLKASPTCTATGKINEVYWCNGGKGDASIEEEAAAASALMGEVGGILGVEFQYFAHLNWGSLVQIVNTLGGITVNLDEGVYDYGWTGAVFEPGVDYTINGEQALGLARARHGTTGGDFTRGASQQKILIGIKNKLMEKDLSVTDILSLAGTLGDNLRSNFSLDEMKTLAHMSNIFDLESMRQISLFDPANSIYLMKTANINGISYVIPSAGVGNYGAIQNYISPLLSSDPRVYEEPSILILNATGESGVAVELKNKLENEEGYTIAAVDNIEGDFPDSYTLYVTSDKVSGTEQMLEDYFGVFPITGDAIPENIPRNYDLILVVGPSNTSE